MSGDGERNVATAPACDDALAMLREQALLYAELEGLAKRQTDLVTHDDTGPLLTLLADRQRLSDRLVRLGARLAPVRENWASYRDGFSPSQRCQADRCLREASAALQRVLERDAQDARVLSGRKQTVVAALGRTHSTRQALSAYRSSAPPSERLDCTDEVSS